MSIALFSNAFDGRDEGHYGSSVGKFLMRRPISENHLNASVTGCIHPSMNSVPLSTFQTMDCTISPRMSFKTKTQPNVNYLATLIPREDLPMKTFAHKFMQIIMKIDFHYVALTKIHTEIENSQTATTCEGVKRQMLKSYPMDGGVGECH